MTTAIGDIELTRRYWKCTNCGCGAYATDAVLGIEGERFSKTVQKHCCRLAADASFDAASNHIKEMLGVLVSPETVRMTAIRHGRAMATFQARDAASEKAFQEAKGEVEFTVDAAKVHTREEGWKDLKIGVISKREAGKPTTQDDWNKQRLPACTFVLAFAMIAASKTFRRRWRSRFKRLGVACTTSVHVLADGASWIWKAVGRVLTGCIETLDIYHACQRIHKCAERIHGEGTPNAKEAYETGRSKLLSGGWNGLCEWVNQLLQVDDEKELAQRQKATEPLIAYFSRHLQRLNYAQQLQAGRAIGSGQVEGQAKTLGLRLKLRGCRWKKRHIRPMAALVCVRHSSQWTTYWALAN